ncbi:MAG: bifunctional [glutamine synthetase] adenylyltransferase/[glutamine synthetase]-adenylyl-L-tyrosine phosphorylase [Pseudomonadota bacterium]
MTLHSTDNPLTPRPIGDTLSDVARVAAEQAPYLARLLRMHESDLLFSSEAALAQQCEEEISAIGALGETPLEYADLEPLLRRAKQRVHLMLAMLDLACAWSQERVTDALTRFADAALEASLTSALAVHRASPSGFFVFAFGKMGAYELNYSSDVDLAVFFDPETFIAESRGAQEAAIRVVRDVCRLMETQTEDGYVFRTDLRLRPDPSATPAAVSVQRAANYYEEVGQNWERMAWIKARPCAGDFEAAKALQDELRPFVWRRHLDYWTIEDVHAIKRMINAKVGDVDLGAVDCDVKLGPGGIREIEFFAQTQQIILGGRDPALRQRGTLDALAALAQAGCIPADECTLMTEAYGGLRAVEHRIQMLNDAQTHTVPADPSQRERVARLMGMPSLAVFDDALTQTRRQVQATYSALFAEDTDAAHPTRAGNLVFTGVDDDPGTVATLHVMGFSDPTRVISTFRRWHKGFVPATRTARGQALLTALTPRLLEAMSATGDASTAFTNFERFFEGLNAGVQLLSMLDKEVDLLNDLVSSLAIAPRIGRILSQRPSLLESLITREAEARLELAEGASFEEAMDAARRFHRDQLFLTGHALLNGRLPAGQAAASWNKLAREMVVAMSGAAAAETERKFGPVPGRWAVMAMGSFGAGELTAGSDLDMFVIYDPDNSGMATNWFTRFTQRLTTALSAPTGEGVLYEVDMRLRPSGRAGPVAVRLSAFEKYHATDAWTWERMALTRMAPVAGDMDLARRTLDLALASIDAHRRDPELSNDIRDMRARLRAEKRPVGDWDIKSMEGGLVDIEFFVQKHLLIAGGRGAITPNTFDALQKLHEAGTITQTQCSSLQESWTLLSALRQLLKLCLDATPRTNTFSAGLKDRLCGAGGVDDFDALEAALADTYARVLRAI